MIDLGDPAFRAALEVATALPDVDALAAGARLRRDFTPEVAAAALTQVGLRRRARAKFGTAADGLFFTRDGLEQATRPAVAARRAARLAATGATRVVDLGCGIGTDALAFRAAGLRVTAVEADPETAAVAAANLGVPVITGEPAASAQTVPVGPAAAVMAGEPAASAQTVPAGPAAAAMAGDPAASPQTVPADPAAAVITGDAITPAPKVPADPAAAVIVGDAVVLAPGLLADPSVAVFCDPARRTAAGRSWDPADLSPPWAFVASLLDGTRPAAVKAGPGLPHRFIPPGVDAEWVSDGGDVVEVALWAPGTGRRRAVLLPAGSELIARPAEPLPVRPPGAYVFEPDGAAIRAGALDALGTTYGLARLDAQIAYLTGDAPVDSPWLTGFAVQEVLPYVEKTLRAWVREHRIGTLEIKKRGVDVDPAQLRRRLRPSGPDTATWIIAPTLAGVRVLVVRRLPR